MNSLIPAIRRELIIILEKKGFSDAEISRKLKITKAAVSQYKSGKRGHKIDFPEKLKIEIKKSAEAIIKGKSADAEISSLINKMKKSRYICCVCKECGR